MAANDKEVLVKADHVKVYFKGKKRGQTVKAVDDVSFEIMKGETFGVVGESGCGKSTLGRTLIRLQQPTDGHIYLNGTDIAGLKGAQLKEMRKEAQIIICDEAVSALDVSVQAQVLNLLQELKEKLGLTYFFISHNLNVVYQVSDRVGVMYLGNFVEVGEKEKIYSNPMHPYTQALLSAVPVPDPTAKRERILLEGSIPSAHKPPTGCKFHTRCPKCMECCKTQAPERYEVDDGHYVYCHLYDKERREQQK